MDIFKLGEKILDLLEMVFGFWNNQVSLVFALLGHTAHLCCGGFFPCGAVFRDRVLLGERGRAGGNAL